MTFYGSENMLTLIYFRNIFKYVYNDTYFENILSQYQMDYFMIL